MSDHWHYADEIHGAADQHHRHYDTESDSRSLREDLGRAEERIRELEERVSRLERSTPEARRLQYEADLAAAELAASRYDQDAPVGTDRHGPGCQCPYCPGDEEPEESPLARRDTYIGTWSRQDVTRRAE